MPAPKVVSKETFEKASPKLAETLFNCLNLGVGSDGRMKAAKFFFEDSAGEKILAVPALAEVNISPFGWNTSTKSRKTIENPVKLGDLISSIMTAYTHAVAMENAMKVYYQQTESAVGIDWEKIGEKLPA